MRKADLHTHHRSGRSKDLLAVTHEQHEHLDAFVKAADPFVNRDLYGQFLRALHRFQRVIDPLYLDPRVEELLPGLGDHARLHLIEQDLEDLRVAPADIGDEPHFDSSVGYDLPTALGWLWVAEGSKLGAAALLKRAHALGLSESFGARHMAQAPEGRAQHWKSFSAAFDGLEVTEDEEDRIAAGACAAFAHVSDFVKCHLSKVPGHSTSK